jgi:class 3 adenylate cyclase
VRAPTLVVHRSGDPILPEAESREVSELIPEARFVVLDGRGCYPFMDDAGPLLDEIAEFLTGHATPEVPDTVLTTVLFTDIVASTESAQRLGDAAWNDLLESHADAIRRQVRRYDGRLVKDLGDGFMIAFDGPARALRCARACVDAARSVGLTIRAGLHVGECLRRGDDLSGVSVHVAARIAALADGGEVLSSSVVKDLVIGSGLEFEDRGEHELKGVEGSWRLLALAGEV